MKRAFEILEGAMIVQRVFGSPAVALPLQPNFRVAPKLISLDVGLVIHRLQIDAKALKNADLTDAFRGTLAEQVVGQALVAQDMLTDEEYQALDKQQKERVLAAMKYADESPWPDPITLEEYVFAP